MRPWLIPWQDAPTRDLIEMVCRHHDTDNPMGAHLVDFQTWSCPALSQFMIHAMGLLNTLPGQGKMMLYSVITPRGECAGGWARGYPHTHGYANYSLVHYLQPGDAYAPLVVFEEDDTTAHWVTPETGLTVVFEGHQRHGVLDSAGDEPRVALVLQSMPEQAQVH